MMVGYADNHAVDCYRMYDPKTRRVHATRYMLWLKNMYYTSNVMPIKINEEKEDEGEEMYGVDGVDSKVEGQENANVNTTLCKELVHQQQVEAQIKDTVKAHREQQD